MVWDPVMLRAFLRCERGATSIEYALIGGAIFLVIVASVGAVGTALVGRFEAVGAGFNTTP
jgi:Flp pilus assembly pilin Flp